MAHKPRLLGISGKRGVGKTTAADYLVQYYGFKKIAFADALRDLAKTMFPFTDNHLRSPKFKEKPFQKFSWTPRGFLIGLGEFARYYDEEYWTKRAVQGYLKSKKGYYVIDDVRYENEADLVEKLGGNLVRINRYEKDNPYGPPIDNISETDLDKYKKFQFVVNEFDNKDVQQLCTRMDFLMQKIWEIEHVGQQNRAKVNKYTGKKSPKRKPKPSSPRRRNKRVKPKQGETS